MNVENRMEPQLRASLRRAAEGPDPAFSLADVARRAERRRARRRAGAMGTAALVMVVVAGTVNVIAERVGDETTSMATGGGESPAAPSRPLISLPECRATTATQSSGADVPLGRAGTSAKSVQVLFEPTRPPPSGPLVIIERVQGAGEASPDGRTGEALTANDTLQGQDATIAPLNPEGQSGAEFELADGSLGVITTRKLTLDQVRQVLEALRPRPGPGSGFDLVSAAPAGLQLVDVPPLPTEVRKARSDCVFGDGSNLFVAVITGEPAVRYAALSSEPADAIGHDIGDSTITVSGPPGHPAAAAALAAVSDAAPDHWRSLLAADAREGPH